MQNCYNRGTREEQQSKDDERLTKRHIETLSFVQELGLENKQMKAKIELLEAEMLKCKEIHAFAQESKERLTKLQEQFLKRTDDITAMMTEKHRAEMLKQATEKIEMEQRMQHEIDTLKEELSKLESENAQLSQEISQRSHNSELEELKKQLEDARSQIDRLQIENEDSRTMKDRTVTDLEKIQAEREATLVLTKELKEANQKNRELNFRISKLESQLEDAKCDKTDHELVDSLTKRLTKVHKENQELSQRESEYNSLVNKLYADVQNLTQSLKESEEERRKLKMEYGNLVAEIVNLKKKLRLYQENQNFKEYVALKREISLLKEENTQLKQKHCEKRTSLPMLKACVPLTPSVDTTVLKKEKKQRSQKSPSKLTSIPSLCD
ncbi:uncharacterized protein LOC135475486 [Liolophura sinensis]|uniref:uncharacterized protein LOC135475486 n=1 Tax=Liolophura sinensis TaxID=3198878 RepID=UPI0031595E1B